MLRPRNNATTAQRGLLQTLGGGTTNYLRADGTWAQPPGTGPSAPISVANGGTGLTTPNAVPVVYTLSGIDATKISSPLVFTTDNAGKRFVITGLIYELTTVTGYVSGTLAATWGTTSGGTDIHGADNLTGFHAVNTCYASSTSGVVYASIAPNTTVYVNVTVAVVATAMIMRVHVVGFYL